MTALSTWNCVPLLYPDLHVAAMSIKDVLQSLVDDNYVVCEKIGTSNYYWAFLSQGTLIRQQKTADLEEKVKRLKAKRKATLESTAKAESTRQDTPERKKALADLERLQEEQAALDARLAKFSSCDPEMLDARKQKIGVAKEAVNRWTDNVFAIKSWCQKKFSVDPSVMDKQFGIPSDFDYLD
eukprot:m.29316 g.29316  ORF g.29316 m.29316 type:complete len:183 (+) comp9150_c0_seq1:372-920(+)